MTQACSLGDLLQCGCAESTKSSESPGPDGSWEWGGCGDNIEFGYTKSKEFMDTQIRRRSDVKTLITLHNNEAGRLVSIDDATSADDFLLRLGGGGGGVTLGSKTHDLPPPPRP